MYDINGIKYALDKSLAEAVLSDDSLPQTNSSMYWKAQKDVQPLFWNPTNSLRIWDFNTFGKFRACTRVGDRSSLYFNTLI